MLVHMRNYDFTIEYRRAESARREEAEVSWQAQMRSAQAAEAQRVKMLRVKNAGCLLEQGKDDVL